MPEIRMKVSSTDVGQLGEAIEILRKEAENVKAKFKVIPLPTEMLVIPTRKSPVGNGTATREHRELRIHKRLVIIEGSLSVVTQFAKRAFRHRRPADVNIRVSFREK